MALRLSLGDVSITARTCRLTHPANLEDVSGVQETPAPLLQKSRYEFSPVWILHTGLSEDHPDRPSVRREIRVPNCINGDVNASAVSYDRDGAILFHLNAKDEVGCRSE
jgi:hypothetical protein